MDSMFIQANYNKEVVLTEELINKLKSFKSVALFSSIQFITQMDNIKSQLKDIKIISSKASRVDEDNQLLGCNAYYSSLNLSEEPEAFLYIGDGMFHPEALVLAQKDNLSYKPVIRFNPVEQKTETLDIEDTKQIFKKYRASLMKFLNAKTIGVFVTTKPGQQQLKQAKELSNKFPDKKFYYFAGNNMDFNQLEDFPFVKLWINTACPRIGFNDIMNTNLTIINLTDSLKVNELLSKESILTTS